jgi:hypothetical protein
MADEIRELAQAFIETLPGGPEGSAEGVAEGDEAEQTSDGAENEGADTTTDNQDDDAETNGETEGEAEGGDDENTTQTEPNPAQQLVDKFTPDGVNVLLAMVDPTQARTAVPLVLKTISESLGIPMQELLGDAAAGTDVPDDWEDMNPEQRRAWMKRQVEAEVEKATKPIREQQSAQQREASARRWTENNRSKVEKALRAANVEHYDVTHARLLKVVRENPNAMSSVDDAVRAFKAAYVDQILKVEKARAGQPRQKGPEATTSAAPGGQTRGNTLADEAVATAMESAAQRAR